MVPFVGIYDMLRTELDPNGSFNVTEYGTGKNPEQFRVLYAYSPYHHVVRGSKYPAVLFITGDNDHRVNPPHARKMTAALQERQRTAAATDEICAVGGLVRGETEGYPPGTDVLLASGFSPSKSSSIMPTSCPSGETSPKAGGAVGLGRRHGQ